VVGPSGGRHGASGRRPRTRSPGCATVRGRAGSGHLPRPGPLGRPPRFRASTTAWPTRPATAAAGSTAAYSGHSVRTTSASAPTQAATGSVASSTAAGTGFRWTATVGSWACTAAPAASKRSTTSRAGESRRSSVPALKVKPQTATVRPARSPPTARRTLSTMRSNCWRLTSMALSRNRKS